MVIAAHFLAPPSAQSCFFDLLFKLALQEQDQQFIFFVDGERLKTMAPSANIKTILVSPAIKNGLMLQYWYRFKLAKQLKKYATDVFLSDSGAINDQVAVPQLIWVDDIGFLQPKPAAKTLFHKHWRRNFSSSFQKAAQILAAQPFIKTALDALHPSGTSKVMVLPPGLEKDLIPATQEEKQQVIENLSGGTEYFICEVDESSAAHLTIILKAYSIFKKRQKSSMKLVVCLHNLDFSQHVNDFHLYKYRQDVIAKTTAQDAEHYKILAAAYGAIYLPGKLTKANLRGLEILKAGVPLIITDAAETRSVFEDAALYGSPTAAAIAEHMMDLYKDEASRNKLITKGLEQAKRYNWEENVEQLWQTILWHASYKAH